MALLRSILSGATAALGTVIIIYPSAVALGVASGSGMWSGVIALVIGTTVMSVMNQHRALVHVPATSLCVAASAVTLSDNVPTMLAATMLMGLMQIVLGLSRTSWVFHVVPKHIANMVISAVGVVLIGGQLSSLNKSIVLAYDGRLFDGYLTNIGYLGLGVMLIFVLQRFTWTKPLSLLLAPALVVGLSKALGIELPSWNIGTEHPAFKHAVPFYTSFQDIHWLPAVTTACTLLFIATMKETVVLQKVRELDPSQTISTNKQIIWLGVANTLASALGALPLTINTDRTIQHVKSERKNPFTIPMQGLIILAFVFALPNFFSSLPLVVLGMLLIYSGLNLIDYEELWDLRKLERSEAAVCLLAFVGIIVFDIPIGTLLAVGLTLLKLAFTFASDVDISCHEIAPRCYVIHAKGALTFLSIPKLLEMSEAIPSTAQIRLDSRDLYFVDYGSKNFLYDWKKHTESMGGSFEFGIEFARLEIHKPVQDLEKIVLDLKNLDRRKQERVEATGRRAIDRYLAKHHGNDEREKRKRSAS